MSNMRKRLRPRRKTTHHYTRKMCIQHPTILIVSSMNLKEMCTEVLNDGLVIVGPIAEGRDADEGWVMRTSGCKRGGSLLPDLESGVELRLQQIRLICNFFCDEWAQRNYDKNPSALTHSGRGPSERSSGERSNIFAWIIAASRLSCSSEGLLRDTKRIC